eukprot:Tamp_34104.p1 GENE.Tamp_34104~~Tamp_34104.p1  ORF type:complete len:198 (-),score=25.25 Tamp_34104:21-566(-)
MATELRQVRALDPPVCLHGPVVKGFGRGSKTLGIPTANLPQDALAQLPADFAAGIYFGWASVDGAGPYKMVTSVGWNPFFDNKTMTVEPHLLHAFPADFYGSEIRIVITGYLRPEANFSSLEALIDAINLDIVSSRDALQLAPHVTHSAHPHLRLPSMAEKVGLMAMVGLSVFLIFRHRAR